MENHLEKWFLGTSARDYMLRIGFWGMSLHQKYMREISRYSGVCSMGLRHGI